MESTMPEKISALYSDYTIDGIKQDATPAAMLDTLMYGEPDGKVHAGEYSPIVDEAIDPVVRRPEPSSEEISEYLSVVLSAKDEDVPLFCADAYTRCRLASELISTLWRKGNFRLRDLAVSVEWKWNHDAVGARAAFYESVRAFADYADALGVVLKGYNVSESKTRNAIGLNISLSDYVPNIDLFYLEDPFPPQLCGRPPKMIHRRACPNGFVPDENSWVVYIPFDTADFRLGGSVLARSLGLGGAPVEVADADYFIDCYEVVREFVEDGVLLSGETVGAGGLLAAVSRMCASGGCGLQTDVSDLLRSHNGSSVPKILFSEVPGVVVQISDADFDYLDAELLLQDVAYFPLGHPVPHSREVKVKASAKSGIQTILDSLIQNAEGED